jgi:hypothetical protein
MGIMADIKNRIVQFFRNEPPLEYEVTEYVFSDRQPLDDSSNISFFVNNPKPDVSVTRTFDSENQAVNWLIENRDFKKMLFAAEKPFAFLLKDCDNRAHFLTTTRANVLEKA